MEENKKKTEKKITLHQVGGKAADIINNMKSLHPHITILRTLSHVTLKPFYLPKRQSQQAALIECYANKHIHKELHAALLSLQIASNEYFNSKPKREYVFTSDRRGGRKKKPEAEVVKPITVFLSQGRIDELGGKDEVQKLATELLK